MFEGWRYLGSVARIGMFESEGPAPHRFAVETDGVLTLANVTTEAELVDALLMGWLRGRLEAVGDQ
jgi:hypothetical protein